MKTAAKNRHTFISGILLAAALITYLVHPASPLLSPILITASFVAGIPIAVKAIQALRMKAFSIDLLVTIAVIGALIIGEYTESAVVTFLFLFGDYLEARTLRKTKASLKSLMDMAPLEAIVLRDGEHITIPANDVAIGDHVIVQPGGRIPVDGSVISGSASINEAAITGESVPVTKRTGDKVFSSTISGDGYLEISAEKVGDDTTFSKIIELVEEAQERKATSQKFMERFAKYYTPGIIILSVLLWLIMQDVHLALTFLVIACPGALVISVPVSMVAGIGNGAKNGVLIKGGDKMESLAKTQAIAFDKTGTLTKGQPEVNAIKAFGISENDLLKLAAEVESVSEHHLGRTIVRKASERGLQLKQKPSDVEIMKGHGLQSRLASDHIYIGNRTGAEKIAITLDPEKAKYILQQQEQGYTPVLVARNKNIIGIISITDQIREEAPAALRELHNNGIRHTVILTGDNKAVAERTATQLGISGVFAELLPDEKLEKINRCKASGIKLAMVGDGINDAPAVATADVGVAMGGTATDVTLQTADVILMSDQLTKLPYAIRLARATVRNVKQNTFISLVTVALLLVGVMTNHIHLASGMLIHEITVLLVILNAVRLVYFPKYQFNFYRLKPQVNRHQEPTHRQLILSGCAD
jgi:Cd2+/Zn2+-exporting ATPase